jgi:ABC-2 type transport system permease protein
VAEPVAFHAKTMWWRSFRTAAWLGWQIESNWADPFLFAVYSVVKPLAIAGILVVMYGTITGGDFASPVFTYMYLGNAFYLYVGAVMSGMAWAVIDDRERYRMLKSIYVAPVDVRLYLIGRGVARFAMGSISVLITLLVGVWFLEVAVDASTVNWPLFLASLTLGIVMLAMLGLLLASTVLLLGHLSWSIGDAVAGSLFLFCGAISRSRYCRGSCGPSAMRFLSRTGWNCCGGRWWDPWQSFFPRSPDSAMWHSSRSSAR